MKKTGVPKEHLFLNILWILSLRRWLRSRMTMHFVTLGFFVILTPMAEGSSDFTSAL